MFCKGKVSSQIPPEKNILGNELQISHVNSFKRVREPPKEEPVMTRTNLTSNQTRGSS